MKTRHILPMRLKYTEKTNVAGLNQEEIYQNLFRAWTYECTTPELQIIPNKDCFLQDVRQLGQELLQQQQKESSKLAQELLAKTIQNIQFILNDLLEMRTHKIMEAARKLQQIEDKFLFDIEINYYRSLFTAFKGYSKTRRILITSKDSENTPESIPPIQPDTLQKNPPTGVIPSEKPPEINPKPTPIPIPNSSTQEQNSSPVTLQSEKPSQSPQNIPTNPEERVKTASLRPQSPIPVRKSYSGSFFLVRIVKEIPALVGEDFEIYGPFQAEDMTYLPKKNAQILIEEEAAKFVEEIK
jgi:DNA replication initiation complex subunit (GINS family)